MTRTKVTSRKAAKAAAKGAIRLLKDVNIYLINARRYEDNPRLRRRVQYAAERVNLVVRSLPQ